MNEQNGIFPGKGAMVGHPQEEVVNNAKFIMGQKERREPSVIVHSNVGDLEGFKFVLENGDVAEIFLGIPYAKPPIGKLRFEKPQPIEKWQGIRCTKEFGPASYSADFERVASNPAQFSEDSLTINIFRPAKIVPGKLLPTILYVHGGGFGSGSARDYGYRQLANNFIPLEIIFVTIQYRLGPFGFLTLGRGSALPGNLGLWDQILGLKFLHENVSAFGGDPAKINVMGLSAGAASVDTLSLSPHSKGLIAKTIEISGSVLPEWSASEQTVTASIELIEAVLAEKNGDIGSLNFENSSELKNQLKQVPVAEINKALKAMNPSRYALNLLKFGPRIDGDLLPNDFPILLRESQRNKKPVMMGLTSNEAIYLAIQNRDPFLRGFVIERQKLNDFGELEFRNFLKNCVLAGHFSKFVMKKSAKLIEQVEDEICEFYLKFERNAHQMNGLMENVNSSAKYLQAYCNILSDMLFNVPIYWMAELRKQFQLPTYLYFNKYFNDNQFEPWVPIRASTHANEYPYFNGLFPVGKFKFGESDQMHRKIIVDMISRFVKNEESMAMEYETQENHGKTLLKWPSNTSNNCPNNEGLQFMIIDSNNNCTVGELEWLSKAADFWTNFNKKYGFNLIRGIPNK